MAGWARRKAYLPLQPIRPGPSRKLQHHQASCIAARVLAPFHFSAPQVVLCEPAAANSRSLSLKSWLGSARRATINGRSACPLPVQNHGPPLTMVSTGTTFLQAELNSNGGRVEEKENSLPRSPRACPSSNELGEFTTTTTTATSERNIILNPIRP